MKRWGAVLAGCVCLAACARADSQVSFLPDKYKDKAPGPPVAEPMPDVKAVVRERGKELFASAVDSILVGPPHPKGTHWEFCVKPIGRGVGGQPLPPQIYLVEIERGVIGDRLPVGGSHWCAREPLSPA